MRVIPVIDLMEGHVVRGVAGRRSEYRPIQSQIAANSRPETVARAFADRFGFTAAYVANLDAILDPSEQKQQDVACYRQIADRGLALWLDAGIGDANAARRLHATLEHLQVHPQFVIGLESLSSQQALREIGAVLDPRHTIVSLDLQAGEPLTSIAAWQSYQPLQIAREVLATKTSRLIVLDLADVGAGGGTRTLKLCGQLRREFPAIELIAGGGVRGVGDLLALAEAGCDAALVASALHDGRLTRAEIRQVENLPP